VGYLGIVAVGEVENPLVSGQRKRSVAWCLLDGLCCIGWGFVVCFGFFGVV
jgi:hypothetical protein